MRGSYWIETLGCAKNEVDSDHIAGGLLAEGYVAAGSAEEADLVVVNTCAFIESARAESIETILDLGDRRREASRLVVTGCLAARAGAEIADALPEVDLVADVGVPVTFTSGPRWRAAPDRTPSLDLMRIARPPASAPWAYVKIAEGCDRRCGFCAIPSFRGPQRSRPTDDLVAEVDALGVREVVLVSQDLASFGRDRGEPGSLSDLVARVVDRVEWVRLLYLFPTALTDRLIGTIVATGVPYFDLSLQHVSAPHLRRMRRPGSRAQVIDKIGRIRSLAPEATLRSSFILGYPGETEEDHDELLGFLDEAQLDWVGLFPYSAEEGTFAAGRDDQIDPELALERLRECASVQEAITARRRSALVGTKATVLVDGPGTARSVREAPEIDGVIAVPDSCAVGSFVDVAITAANGPDLEALPVGAAVSEEKTFGPTAILTPANGLTVARLIAAPVFAVIVGLRTSPGSWWLFVVWAVLALSDGVDGRVARRHGPTRSGAFLDPLADKFLVLSALGALIALGVIAIWPVVVIAGREIAVSALRVVAARRYAVSVPARPLAKCKTLVQDLAVGAAFIPQIGDDHVQVVRIGLYLAVALTLASGLEYALDARRILQVPTDEATDTAPTPPSTGDAEHQRTR